MFLGQQLSTYGPGRFGNHFDTTLAVAKACEDAGLDSVWLADHFMFPDSEHPEKEVPVMECMVALGAIAARTERIRLGGLVIGVPYRNPALLAKMCSTLDVISHGRTIIGLGAAWHEPEFKAYGWEFPSVRDRMGMLGEAAQIVRKMMTERPASFEGEYYRIRDAYNDPMPVQKPSPPIMIGGSGERTTLRLVARYADFCNVFGGPEAVQRRFSILRGHCERVGRDYSEITKSNQTSILIARDGAELEEKKRRFPGFNGVMGTPDQVIEGLRKYVEAGSQYVTFSMPDAEDVEPVLLLGETVVPEVAKFEAAT